MDETDEMNEIKAEPTVINYNASYAKCLYCQASKIEPSAQIDSRDREILILKQRIQNLEGVIESLTHDLNEKDSQL